MTALVLHAYWELLRFDWRMGRSGFSGVHRALSVRAPGSVAALAETVQAIVRAVDRAAMFYPRHVRCLQRSVAATAMLRRQGIAANLVIGIQLAPFFSHAWVEVNGSIVNDLPSYPARMLVLDRV